MNVRRIVPLVVVPLLALSGCGLGSGSDNGANGSGKAGKVTVVSQQFTEAEIMSELYKDLLAKSGFSVTVKNFGTRDIYLPALIKGDVQVSADYLSSMTEALNRKANGDNAPLVASPDEAKTLAALDKLAAKDGLTALKPAPAQDANAFAVTKKFASQHHLTTLSDLGKSGLTVALGAASDCPQRPDCKLGLQSKYGIKISKVVPTGFDSAPTKQDLVKGRTQLGLVSTTDASLTGMGLVILTDDKHLQNAENLIPIVNTAWLRGHAKARTALEKLAGVLTTADLTGLIGKVDNQRQKAADVAQQYLKSKGLI